MTANEYLHGYDETEQRRLVDQADFWRKSLIPLGLTYAAGERILEIGCAVGASLAVLAERFPGIRVAGVDLELRQLGYAKKHLASVGVEHPELVLGDATRLPWDDAAFDHVYLMWLLEHLRDPLAALREAHRVTRPGGTICVTETDYTTFSVHPANTDFEYLRRAQEDFYRRHGQATVGRTQGNLLWQAGFREVTNRPVGFHAFARGNPGELRGYVRYIAGFLEPAIPRLVDALGLDNARLRSGIDHLHAVADHADGAFTQIVYRATGRKE